MRALFVTLAACFAVAMIGCGPSKTPEQTQPKVTLMKRDAERDTITMKFSFTDMDRVNWKNKVLRVQLVKWGEKPGPGGAQFKDPSPEFVMEVAVGKPEASESVLFVPVWGQAVNGVLTAPQPFDLSTSDGTANKVTLAGLGAQRVNQILNAFNGPARPVRFNPAKGIDLFTLGYAPDAYNLHVWVGPPEKKKAPPTNTE
jgi:hypothetical protein